MSNLRNDKLWDDLVYNLQHPMSEEEKRIKEAQEAEKREQILDRIWGKDSRSMQTGGAAPIEGYVRKDSDPYKEIQEDKTLSTAEKVARIKEVTAERNKQIDKEHIKKMAQYYGGAGLEAASMFLPGGPGVKIASKIAKPLATQVGRKIASEIANGVVKGAASGAVEGFGRGMLEDKNPLKTSAEDMVDGATLGLGFGVAGGNVQKAIRGRKLKNTNDTNVARRKAKEYYKDYLIDTSVSLPNEEKVIFSNSGLKKSLSNSADVRTSQSVPDLPKLIREGNVEGGLYPNKEKAKFDKYHYIANEDYKINQNPYPNRITIGENSNGKFFYNINDIEYPSAMHRKDAIPLPSEQILGGMTSNNIISESPRKLKSWQEWLEDLKRGRGH